MTASIAHEISQPLAAITTHGHAGLRWLSRVAPDIAEASVALRRIVENAERLSTIINGIRAMFKTDSAEKTNVRINDVIFEVLSFANTELHQIEVLVQSDLIQDLPPLPADRVQLQQVFFNLISNAIEAMRSISNRPRVLTIKSEMNPPNSVVITFADTGIGIEPKDLDRIFAPFVTTKARGMGMGLAICRSILEAHGGRIWVTAADPCGSVFHVRLPITTP
jgi:signal transduction histidine kinase